MQEAVHAEFSNIALIGMGSNVASWAGSPAETLIAAAKAISGDSVQMLSISRLFLTPCYPTDAGPDYVNAVALVSTALSPEALLVHLHSLEAGFGRQRLQRWGNRTLDLDLLTYGDLVWPDLETYTSWYGLGADQQRLRAPEQLILPHPRIQDRAFVLVPLLDVAPLWHHPVLEGSAQDLLDLLPQEEVRAVIPR